MPWPPLRLQTLSALQPCNPRLPSVSAASCRRCQLVTSLLEVLGAEAVRGVACRRVRKAVRRDWTRPLRIAKLAACLHAGLC
eukprot:scaffold63_cov306-Pinguiococcus_pyrenoidosus.AAC.1